MNFLLIDKLTEYFSFGSDEQFCYYFVLVGLQLRIIFTIHYLVDSAVRGSDTLWNVTNNKCPLQVTRAKRDILKLLTQSDQHQKNPKYSIQFVMICNDEIQGQFSIWKAMTSRVLEFSFYALITYFNSWIHEFNFQNCHWLIFLWETAWWKQSKLLLDCTNTVNTERGFWSPHREATVTQNRARPDALWSDQVWRPVKTVGVPQSLPDAGHPLNSYVFNKDHALLIS